MTRKSTAQAAIEELRAIKDRCAQYAEELRIANGHAGECRKEALDALQKLAAVEQANRVARDLLEQSEAERETLKSERRGLLGLVRAALEDIVGTEGKHLLDLVGSVKAKLRESESERERLQARFTAPIVCMCGSTRFKQSWISENARLTGEGYIVLAVGLWGHHERVFPSDEQKAMLDDLHKRKIDLCDWVWVLDVGGYIGSSTRSEIEYAQKLGKPVRYLSAEYPGYQEPVDPVAANRDRLARELAEAKQSIDGLNEQYDAALETVVRLQGELAEAKKDTARLDWLEAHPFMAYRDRDPATMEMYDHFTVVDEDRHPRTGIVKPTLRAALDAARNGGPDAH